MNQLTIGQRIASRRKLLNLSQEALAEQLTVSRQAVSKWESDATIPEIDKLIVLAKLFDVSVGWILGMEEESASAFTETQLQTLEQLLVRYSKPKSRLLWRVTALVCAVAIAVTGFALIRHRIDRISDENQALSSQVSELNADNLVLKEQITDLNLMISEQIKSEQLLKDVKLQAFYDEVKGCVNVAYYMTPKVYQSHRRAFLWVQNPKTGYDELIKCQWNAYNSCYVVRFDCPVADGYKWSFLYMDNTMEEENLMLRDRSIAYLATYCTFHLSPYDPQHIQMQSGFPTQIASGKELYTFNQPIYTPHIFVKTAVAFRYINITLQLNGETIWESSYLEDFKNLMDVPNINGGDNGVYPGISVELPELTKGDTLKLILTAETVNGGAPTQQYETLLDYRIVGK